MQNKFQEEFKQQQLRKCQLKQLSILETVDAICKKHNIEYWLDGGTLLGAVRHKGFIPWDDDIDIAMTLDNLERFLEIAPKELPDNLYVQDPAKTDTTKSIVKIFDLNSFYVEPSDDFKLDYQKCVYIDIFPFIDYPNVSRNFVHRFVKQYARSAGILRKKHYYSLRSIVEFFYFGVKYYFNKIVCWLTFNFVRKNKYYGNVLLQNGYGIMHEKNGHYPLSSVFFEGKQFPAPRDYDAYLRDLFGDYMVIPPKEKQRIHSVFIQTELI